MGYAFQLRQVCGGYAYFSTFTLGQPSQKDRYEKRMPSQVNNDRFNKALAELGQPHQFVNSKETYKIWMHTHGWAIIDEMYAKKHMAQWLKQQHCIRSSYGIYINIEIASPKTLLRTYRSKAKKNILDRDGNKCLLCTSSENLTLQHVWPFSKAGETNSENMITLCEICNQKLADNINTDLYSIAGLHYGFEWSLIKTLEDLDRAIDRAIQISNNLMHTRCEIW